MKQLLALIFLIPSLTGLVGAQETPPKNIRFMPLGEMPVSKQKIKDNIRELQRFPKGSMPPEVLSIVSGDAVIPLKLNLKVMSNRLSLKGGTPVLALKNGKGPDAPTWLTSPMPSTPLSLGVLYCDPQTMKWDNPKMLLLKDDASSFPAGHIRFVNVSKNILYVMMGDPKTKRKMLGVKPGKSLTKAVKRGDDQIEIGYFDQNNKKQNLYNNRLKFLENQRVHFFFYAARNPRSTGPVRFSHISEPVPGK